MSYLSLPPQNVRPKYKVGQKVKIIVYAVGDPPSGDSPGGTYAEKGEILIVRKINDELDYPISVSHEHVLDKSFGVKYNEITPFYED